MSKLTHVVDWTTSKSIKIEDYAMGTHAGWNPYARFTVYPANGIIVKTNIGTLTSLGSISKLVSESVSISKKISQASMKIDSLVSQSGLFFDENDNLVTPNFTVTAGGLLETTIDCSGTAVIEYFATVQLFEYNAEIETVLGGGTNIKTGIIWAYDENAPKNLIPYQIPDRGFTSTEQARIARIYREILVADKRYEMPTTFTDTEISYTSYPSANTSELSTDTRKDEITQEELLWDGITVQTRDRFSKDWCYPVTDHIAGFLGVQWKISVEIPDELSANTEVSNAVAALQAKYGL